MNILENDPKLWLRQSWLHGDDSEAFEDWLDGVWKAGTRQVISEAKAQLLSA